jgi:hypothetical protein
MRVLIDILATMLVIAFLGCSSTAVNRHIVNLAIQYAKQAGYLVNEYDVEPKKGQSHEVWVFFTGKVKRPGNHFAILVDTDKNTYEIFAGH